MVALTSTEYTRIWREQNKEQWLSAERRRYREKHAEILEKKRLYRLRKYYQKHGADAPPLKPRKSNKTLPPPTQEEVQSNMLFVKRGRVLIDPKPVSVTFD
jgi:hypothetical protein